MITKILFTLTVIVGVILFFKTKRGNPAANRTAVKVEESENQKMFRQGAYLFLVLMIISAVVMMSMNFFEKSSTVTVSVINTQTGKQITYKAERQDVKSRQFKTILGRTVFVAESERIEIIPD